jgi:hypothetical protein
MISWFSESVADWLLVFIACYFGAIAFTVTRTFLIRRRQKHPLK